MGKERLLMVSSDCHGGPQTMAEYRAFLPGTAHAAYDGYLAACRHYDDAVTAARELEITLTQRQLGWAHFFWVSIRFVLHFVFQNSLGLPEPIARLLSGVPAQTLPEVWAFGG